LKKLIIISLISIFIFGALSLSFLRENFFVVNMFFPPKDLFSTQLAISNENRDVFGFEKVKYPGMYVVFVDILNANELERIGYQVSFELNGKICFQYERSNVCEAFKKNQLQRRSYQDRGSFVLTTFNLGQGKLAANPLSIKVELSQPARDINRISIEKVPDW
jgi:hypothetical protein